MIFANVILKFLLLLSCLTFIYGIIKATKISLTPNPNVSQMPVFLSNAVTAIAAVFATNLGAVLGFSVVNGDAGFFRAEIWNPVSLFKSDAIEPAQAFAVVVYLLGLLAATLVWLKKDFTQDNTQIVSLLPELTKSLLGVVIGSLAISLKISKA